MKAAQFNLFNKIGLLEKLLFTKHLAIMLKSGITISESLSTLSLQTKSSKFKKILQNVLSSIENGDNLANSLKKHSQVFDPFYISLVEVGEEAGKLEENLEFLAKQLSKDYALRKKVQGAMLYPGIILSATLIMGTFITIFILPKLVDFFSVFDMDLPITTQILISIANISKDYGIFIIIGLIMLLFFGSIIINIPEVKLKWHTFILKIPIFGNMFSYNQLSRFSRNLGTLIKSGIPIIKSLDVTEETLTNLKFKNDLLKVSQAVTKGKNISEAISQKGINEFPPLVIKMIEVGEKTGKLDETLLYLGDFYEEEIDDISRNLTTILEPVLLIFIGVLVGFVALAIIGPIYQFVGGMHR